MVVKRRLDFSKCLSNWSLVRPVFGHEAISKNSVQCVDCTHFICALNNKRKRGTCRKELTEGQAKHRTVY